MRLLLSIIICTLIISCSVKKADLVKEEKAIRVLLQQERKAHFDRNVDLFISEFSDSMINVNKGKINTPTKEDHKERIGKYFGSVQFIKWDDVADPIIRFSDDGSLAYAIVQKKVIVSYPDSFGNSITDSTDYAWVSIYRKQKGGWKVELNASTNK